MKRENSGIDSERLRSSLRLVQRHRGGVQDLRAEYFDRHNSRCVRCMPKTRVKRGCAVLVRHTAWSGRWLTGEMDSQRLQH